MKNTRGGTNSRLDDTEGWISELEDSVMEITDGEQKTEEWQEMRTLKENSETLSTLICTL